MLFDKYQFPVKTYWFGRRLQIVDAVSKEVCEFQFNSFSHEYFARLQQLAQLFVDLLNHSKNSGALDDLQKNLQQIAEEKKTSTTPTFEEPTYLKREREQGLTSPSLSNGAYAELERNSKLDAEIAKKKNGVKVNPVSTSTSEEVPAEETVYAPEASADVVDEAAEEQEVQAKRKPGRPKKK